MHVRVCPHATVNSRERVCAYVAYCIYLEYNVMK